MREAPELPDAEVGASTPDLTQLIDSHVLEELNGFIRLDDDSLHAIVQAIVALIQSG